MYHLRIGSNRTTLVNGKLPNEIVCDGPVPRRGELINITMPNGGLTYRFRVKEIAYDYDYGALGKVRKITAHAELETLIK
jgi:hypothetical protein